MPRRRGVGRHPIYTAAAGPVPVRARRILAAGRVAAPGEGSSDTPRPEHWRQEPVDGGNARGLLRAAQRPGDPHRRRQVRGAFDPDRQVAVVPGQDVADEPDRVRLDLPIAVDIEQLVRLAGDPEAGVSGYRHRLDRRALLEHLLEVAAVCPAGELRDDDRHRRAVLCRGALRGGDRGCGGVGDGDAGVGWLIADEDAERWAEVREGRQEHWIAGRSVRRRWIDTFPETERVDRRGRRDGRRQGRRCWGGAPASRRRTARRARRRSDRSGWRADGLAGTEDDDPQARQPESDRRRDPGQDEEGRECQDETAPDRPTDRSGKAVHPSRSPRREDAQCLDPQPDR